MLRAFYSRITPDLCRKLIVSSEEYLNKQISLDPVCGRLGAVGYFVNPPHINASDEIVDFDGIDLVSDEDPDLGSDDDDEDC